MRRFAQMILLLALAVAYIKCPALAADDEFRLLFNGKDLTGWKVFLPNKDGTQANPTGTWKAEDGMLRCTGSPNGYVLTEKEYSNYVLKVSWRYPADVMTKSKRPNSGILLHVTGKDRLWPHAIEAQLAIKGVGDIYLNADDNKQMPKLEVEASRKDPASKEGRHFFKIGGKDKQYDKPFGEWNTYEITCTKNGGMVIKVNGELANDATAGSLQKGRIALQSEGAPIDFKDILIKELK